VLERSLFPRRGAILGAKWYIAEQDDLASPLVPPPEAMPR